MMVENVRDVKPHVAHDQLICRLLLKGNLKEFHGLWHGILKPGTHTAEHAHLYEEFYFIISGDGIMTVGDEKREVKALDVIAIPSGAKHGLLNNTDGDITYICAAAPPFRGDEGMLRRDEGYKPDSEFKKMVEEGKIDTGIK